MKPFTFCSFWFALIVVALMLPQEAFGIPAFARRHKVSCTTCHDPFPRLKPYGEEFAGNGFAMAETEKERDYVSAGDPLLKLNRDFPLAVRFDAYAVFRDENAVDSDLAFPWGVKILSGGTLASGVGYYFYFYMDERGEVAGVEDAYIHFNDIGGTPLDLMVGQFQTSDPLLKRELRLTFEDYELYRYRVDQSGTNLTYDRGIMATYGFETSGTDLALFVVNGNGIGEADQFRRFDNNSFKNVGARVVQDLMGVAGIGYFAFYGEEYTTDGPGIPRNEVLYFGPDISAGTDKIALAAQFLRREDSNPDFDSAGGDDVQTDATVVEIVVMPQGENSRFVLAGLYNHIDSEKLDYETATGSASYLLARNLRLVAEYTRDIENERNRGVAGISGAF